MQFSDRLDHILDRQVIDTACADNLLIQSGVLRTNCIDCLDRTNGGQFAVGLYFLRVALYTLGLRSRYSKNLEIHKDPMLLMLMEMYGEMADKIALQYGGSEAHKKVIAGKSSAASKSKQNELLTSIKRYYSNAFTDMVKQDAMNIFLGCFIPSESSIPLWDLESDYYLHNLTLHPPHPLVYDVLYWKVGDMMRKLEDGSPIRLRMDGMVKKMMQWMVSKAAAKVAKRVTDLEDGGKESMQEDRGMGKEQQAQDEVLEVEGIVLTAAQCEKLLKRYYMRFLARSANGSGESTLPKTPSSSKLAAALPPPPSTPPASRATAAPATATSTAE